MFVESSMLSSWRACAGFSVLAIGVGCLAQRHLQQKVVFAYQKIEKGRWQVLGCLCTITIFSNVVVSRYEAKFNLVVVVRERFQLLPSDIKISLETIQLGGSAFTYCFNATYMSEPTKVRIILFLTSTMSSGNKKMVAPSLRAILIAYLAF